MAINVVSADGQGKPRSLEVDDDGNLKIAGTFSADPPIGGATEDKQDAIIAAIEGITVTPYAGVDSAGDPLPEDFDFLAETYGYTSTDLTTIVKTKGADTWTQTLTYSSHVLTATSQWVKA